MDTDRPKQLEVSQDSCEPQNGKEGNRKTGSQSVTSVPTLHHPDICDNHTSLDR